MNPSDEDSDTQPAGRGARQKGKRNSKTNQAPKTFDCGCGKSYLTEAKLKTHVKTSHKGKAPANLAQQSQPSQPQTNGKTDKKNSKKGAKGSKQKDEEMEEEKIEENSTDFENIIKFLNELSSKIAYDGQKVGADQNSLVTHTDEVDAIKHFPLDIFKGREDEYKTVLEDLNALVSGKAIVDESVDPETDLKQTSINKILALLLFKLSCRLRFEFYRELVFFVLIYRRALNQIGYETKNKLTGAKGEGDEEKEFCENNNGEFVPEISNYFLHRYLPEYLKDYNLKGFKVIGSQESQIKNAVHLTKHFCNWLNIQNYTCSHLIMNDEGN